MGDGVMPSTFDMDGIFAGVQMAGIGMACAMHRTASGAFVALPVCLSDLSARWCPGQVGESTSRWPRALTAGVMVSTALFSTTFLLATTLLRAGRKRLASWFASAAIWLGDEVNQEDCSEDSDSGDLTPTALTVTSAVADLRKSFDEMRRLRGPATSASALRKIGDALTELELVTAIGATKKRENRFTFDTISSVSGDRTPPSECLPGQGYLEPALNAFVREVWPRVDQYVERMLHETIEPAINASLPGLLQGGVKFNRVTLGDSPPVLGPLMVEADHAGSIEMHVGVCYKSELEVGLKAMGISVGIRRFVLEGELVVLFAPPRSEPPFFGGLQIFFPNPPRLSVDFLGAAQLADLPGLRGAVRSAIAGAIARACVLPRRIAVDLAKDGATDITDLKYPEPIGVLRFRLWSGSGLVTAETLSEAGPNTSRADPYVVVSLGPESWTSPVVARTSRPIWNGSEGLCVDFPVHNESQVLTLAAFDQSFAAADDLIGIGRLTVAHLASRPGAVDVPLLSNGAESGPGSLRISAQLMKLTQDRTAALRRSPGPSEAHFSLKVSGVRGLDVDAEYPFRVRLRILDFHASRESSKRRSAPERSRLSLSLSPPPSVRGLGQLLPGSSRRRQAEKQVEKDEGGFRVLAEASTEDSRPPPELTLSQTLQGVCLSLHHGGHGTRDIAQLLGVERRQVARFLKRHEQSSSQAAMAEAVLAATKPWFNEVLQVLLPEVGEATVELAVLDKSRKILGVCMIPLQNVAMSEDMRLNGPFALACGEEDAAGAEIVGSAWLRWLA